MMSRCLVDSVDRLLQASELPALMLCKMGALVEQSTVDKVRQMRPHSDYGSAGNQAPAHCDLLMRLLTSQQELMSAQDKHEKQKIIEAMPWFKKAMADCVLRTAEAWVLKQKRPNKQPVRIPADQVWPSWHKELGSGATCTVYEGQYLLGPDGPSETVAIKVVENLERGSRSYMARMEVEALSLLPESEHILKFYGVSVGKANSTSVCASLVMELADDSLSELIMSTDKKPDISFAVTAGVSLCKGLHWLHDQCILHRDIKTDNVLIVKDKLKLSDFGLAAGPEDVAPDGRLIGPAMRVGTPAYMSPQCDAGEAYQTVDDVWCLMIVMIEISLQYLSVENYNAIAKINDLARSVQPNLRSDPASQAPVDTHVRWCLYHLNWRADVVQAIQHEHRRAVWVHLYGEAILSGLRLDTSTRAEAEPFIRLFTSLSDCLSNPASIDPLCGEVNIPTRDMYGALKGEAWMQAQTDVVLALNEWGAETGWTASVIGTFLFLRDQHPDYLVWLSTAGAQHQWTVFSATASALAQGLIVIPEDAFAALAALQPQPGSQETATAAVADEVQPAAQQPAEDTAAAAAVAAAQPAARFAGQDTAVPAATAEQPQPVKNASDIDACAASAPAATGSGVSEPQPAAAIATSGSSEASLVVEVAVASSPASSRGTAKGQATSQKGGASPKAATPAWLCARPRGLNVCEQRKMAKAAEQPQQPAQQPKQLVACKKSPADAHAQLLCKQPQPAQARTTGRPQPQPQPRLVQPEWSIAGPSSKALAAGRMQPTRPQVQQATAGHVASGKMPTPETTSVAHRNASGLLLQGTEASKRAPVAAAFSCKARVTTAPASRPATPALPSTVTKPVATGKPLGGTRMQTSRQQPQVQLQTPVESTAAKPQQQPRLAQKATQKATMPAKDVTAATRLTGYAARHAARVSATGTVKTTAATAAAAKLAATATAAATVAAVETYTAAATVQAEASSQLAEPADTAAASGCEGDRAAENTHNTAAAEPAHNEAGQAQDALEHTEPMCTQGSVESSAFEASPTSQQPRNGPVEALVASLLGGGAREMRPAAQPLGPMAALAAALQAEETYTQPALQLTAANVPRDSAAEAAELPTSSMTDTDASSRPGSARSSTVDAAVTVAQQHGSQQAGAGVPLDATAALAELTIRSSSPCAQDKTAHTKDVSLTTACLRPSEGLPFLAWNAAAGSFSHSSEYSAISSVVKGMTKNGAAWAYNGESSCGESVRGLEKETKGPVKVAKGVYKGVKKFCSGLARGVMACYGR